MEKEYSDICSGYLLTTLGNLFRAVSAGAVQVMRDRPPVHELNIFRYEILVFFTSYLRVLL